MVSVETPHRITRTARMKGKLFTIPNFLSALRMVLVVPFALVLTSDIPNARWWGIGIALLAMLTDKLDGDLARYLHAESEWGRILDPLADKVAVATIAIILLWLGIIPLWFVIVLVARDLLILAGGLYLKKRTGEVLPSNMAGKWAVGVISMTMLLALIDENMWIVPVGIWMSVAMVLLSTVLYVKRFVAVVSKEK
ncbi:MAG: CDP-alcohol phosphatidyltransferase [Bacteroidetes bacterium]|jgi:CDP-diacylglycerol--glycerol-3-phosphate 3-phosphatidyltransferase|nr:CDP-alcohol phosphatidyltransferase [Bacteroidota bacterium]